MSNGLGTATSSGIQFGPNRKGRVYISVFIHRGNNRSKLKNKWHPDVPPLMEYAIFNSADYANWYDVQGHYGGVHERGKTIPGCQSERLCKFPRTSNPNDPWHGYPASPLENGDDDAPPDDFVESWIETGIISKTFGRRIQRSKV